MTLESMTETVSKKIYFLLQEKCFFLTYFLIGVAGTPPPPKVKKNHPQKKLQYRLFFMLTKIDFMFTMMV